MVEKMLALNESHAAKLAGVGTVLRGNVYAHMHPASNNRHASSILILRLVQRAVKVNNPFI